MNNLETSFGFRTKFSGGSLHGLVGMNGKAVSVYTHNVEFFTLGFQTMMNFKRPEQPVQFGINFSLGQM
jgi:hypothetical protein